MTSAETRDTFLDYSGRIASLPSLRVWYAIRFSRHSRKSMWVLSGTNGRKSGGHIAMDTRNEPYSAGLVN